MVMIPTAITSTRKNVANPSTISMPPKAGPEWRYAHQAPPSAATRVSRLRWPKASDEPLWISGSSTIRSVPITIRMISGKKRMASRELKTKLPGTRHLCRGLSGGAGALARGPAPSPVHRPKAGQGAGRGPGGPPHRDLYPIGHVHLRLLQDACGDLAD